MKHIKMGFGSLRAVLSKHWYRQHVLAHPWDIYICTHKHQYSKKWSSPQKYQKMDLQLQ